MKKKAIVLSIFILSFILCAISLSGCGLFFNDSVPRNKIFAYVNDNHELLEAFPYAEMPKEPQEKKNYIINYLGKNTIVKSVYAFNENILRFTCGGSGLATGSTYTGFYFSKDDTPFALEFDGHELIEIEPGIFEWQNEDGRHKIHIEKIRDHWYYFVMDYY